MNNAVFAQAQSSYDRQNYAEALELFYRCVQDTSFPLQAGEFGRLFHRIGNCQVKLGNYNEAIKSYSNATSDDMYSDRASAFYNLGMAFTFMNDFPNAIANYEIAINDPSYSNKYKAYTAMGNALMKSGKVPEAGSAFRKAALDDANPEPTRALLNLGVCFMALGRSENAVTVYESALKLPMNNDVSNRLHANLGQAYVATGQMKKGVDAFEKSLADKTYVLSDSASVDYQRAIEEVSKGNEQVNVDNDPASTARIAAGAVGLGAAAGSMAGAPVQANAQSLDNMAPYNQQPFANNSIPNEYGQPASQYSDDEAFRNWTNNAKEVAYDPQKKISKLKVTLIILLAIFALLLAGCTALYAMGYGFPTQEMTVQKYFSNPVDSKNEVFSNTVSSQKKDAYVGMASTDPACNIKSVNRGNFESTVYVSAKSKSGGDIDYVITMSRDVLGWKIQSVDLVFASQG